MTGELLGRRIVPCVGAIVHHDDGRLLVVRRKNDPGQGLWSIPGGRVENSESDAAATAREVMEETGLHVTVGRRVGTVFREGPTGTDRQRVSYDIRDYACSVLGPTSPVAGDDADEVRWVTRADLEALPLVPLLWDTLADWGCLPR